MASSNAQKKDFIVQTLSQQVGKNPTLLRGVAATFLIRLTGEPTSQWIVDCHEPDFREVTEEAPIDQAIDCTVELGHADFVDLANGKLTVAQAFMTERLRSGDDPKTLLKLQVVFGL